MRILLALAVASVVLVAPTVASADYDGFGPRRVQQIVISTPYGHVHMTLRPLPTGPIDQMDPWTNQRVATTARFYAPIDTTDPWTGERVSPKRIGLPADGTDP